MRLVGKEIRETKHRRYTHDYVTNVTEDKTVTGSNDFESYFIEDTVYEKFWDADRKILYKRETKK